MNRVFIGPLSLIRLSRLILAVGRDTQPVTVRSVDQQRCSKEPIESPLVMKKTANRQVKVFAQNCSAP